MSIEFRCRRCHSLLRTGDGTEGRQAQCPACGSVMLVPEAGASRDEEPPLQGTYETEFHDSAGPSPEFGARSNRMPPGAGNLLAAVQVYGPATALKVTAALGIGLQVIGIFVNLIRMETGVMPPGAEGLPPEVAAAANLAGGFIGMAVGLLVFYGAWKMERLEGYRLAMTAAILAMIPCISPCCLLGIPFGLWALAVLRNDGVRAAFRS